MIGQSFPFPVGAPSQGCHDHPLWCYDDRREPRQNSIAHFLFSFIQTSTIKLCRWASAIQPKLLEIPFSVHSPLHFFFSTFSNATPTRQRSSFNISLSFVTLLEVPVLEMPPQPTASGIVTDEKSGQRHIPESVRADGTTRRAIKIRPGYRPPEDVEVYKNPTAENFRTRGKGPVPGAEGLKENKPEQSGAANKNAKRREARKKAKAAEEANPSEKDTAATAAQTKVEELDPEAEKEKKVRNLRKKLRQAKELKDKKDVGESLLPEQIAKVIKINELIRELDALGFDADGEPKDANGKGEATEGQS